jgi:hypothetical protein
MKKELKRGLWVLAGCWGLWGLGLQTATHIPVLDAWLKTNPGWWTYIIGGIGSLVLATSFELVLFALSKMVSYFSARKECAKLRLENQILSEKNLALTNDLANAKETSSFVIGHDNLMLELKKIVQEAREYLYITGARTSISSYMKDIEARVTNVKELVHFRILHGYPWRRELKEHLLALRKIRPYSEKVRGKDSCVLGVYIPKLETLSKRNPIKKTPGSRRREAEFFVSINEHRAILIVPSLINPGAFDTGIVTTDSNSVKAWKHYVEWLAGQSEELNTAELIEKLPVLDAVP